MRRDSPDRRKGKRLLVASIGVASVSYLALQGGCTDLGEETYTSGNLLPPPLDAAIDPATTADAAPADAGLDALIGSGNLLPPPVDASSDALITSGNLLPPPPEAGADAAQDAQADAARDGAVRDGSADVGLPSVGNLLPPPKPPVWFRPPPSGETD